MASQPTIQSAEQLHAIIDEWFDDRMKRGPLAHQVDSYNQAFHAKENLKERFAGLFGEHKAAEEPASETASDEAPARSKAKKGESAE